AIVVGDNNGNWQVFPFDKTSYNNGDTLLFNPGSTITLAGQSTPTFEATVVNFDGYAEVIFAANSFVIAESGSVLTVDSGSTVYFSGLMEVNKSGSNPGGELRVVNGAFL